MLTLKQACQRLGCKERKLRQLVYDGLLTPTGEGREWLFYESDIDARLKARQDERRQALMGRKEKKCRSSNAGSVGSIGLNSLRQAEKELDALLAQTTP